MLADEPVTDRPVCVTGASGFVGSQITRLLLERGYRVRGTVRTPEDREKYDYLLSFPGADERFELTGGELLTEGSYDESVAGCEYVIHTASPYVIDVDDPEQDLVKPAVEGTRNVLQSCSRSDATRKVVLTSSMAAVTDEPETDHVLTEEDWNEKSSLERNPYYYSKTRAEKAAWSYVDETDPNLDLVVINPFMVVGPSQSPSLNTSNEIFVDLLTGEYPGIIRITWGFVDVRDVAEAHVRALEHSGAEGRYICANRNASMKEIVELLRENGYDDYDLPSLDLACSFGDYAVKLMSYFESAGTGSYLRTHVGREPNYDNSKIRDDLGMEFRDLEQTILETVEDLHEWGHVEEP